MESPSRQKFGNQRCRGVFSTLPPWGISKLKAGLAGSVVIVMWYVVGLLAKGTWHLPSPRRLEQHAGHYVSSPEERELDATPLPTKRGSKGPLHLCGHINPYIIIHFGGTASRIPTHP